MMRSTSPEGAATALRRRTERPGYVASLPRVRVPTLIVVDSDDAFTSIGDTRLMHRIIPGSTLVMGPRTRPISNSNEPHAHDRVRRRPRRPITGVRARHADLVLTLSAPMVALQTISITGVTDMAGNLAGLLSIPPML